MSAGDALARVIAALDARGIHHTQSGIWHNFRCPAHADSTPSASVRANEKGAGITCHAHCPPDSIVSALGLTMSDLFDEAAKPRTGIDWDHPDSKYHYTDADGTVLFEVRRWSHPEKTFRQFGPDGKPGRPKGAALVVYRLPEVRAAIAAGRDIVVTEGEKSVDRAWREGIPATCSPGGAGKWSQSHSQCLAGAKEVLIVRDHDGPGNAHADQVAASLEAEGIPHSIWDVRSDAPHADLWDHLNADGDIGTLVPASAGRGWIDTQRAATVARTDEKALSAPAPSVRPELAPGALYGVLGDIVRSVEPHTEADPAAILLSLLCMAGIAIGSGPRCVAGMTLMPARLQVWICGPTGDGRKGASLGVARRIMAIADAEFAASRIMSGFGSGEAIVDEVADGSDHRLLCLAPEGASLLAVMSRRGDTTSTILRDSYDSDVLSARARQKNSVAVDSHVGLLVHITPSDLAGGLSDTSIRNGFANRGLFVWSHRGTKRIPRGSGATPKAAEEYARVLGDRIQWARSRSLVTFTDEAAPTWDQYYCDFGSDAPTDLLRDLEVRGEVHVQRICMILALLDGESHMHSRHLAAAMSIWDYCRTSSRMLFGDEGSVESARLLTPQQQDNRKMESDLAKLHDAISDGPLSRTAQFALFGRHRTKVELGRLRTELVRRNVAMERLDSAGVLVLVARE